jgi:hypothetical protein
LRQAIGPRLFQPKRFKNTAYKHLISTESTSKIPENMLWEELIKFLQSFVNNSAFYLFV